MNGLFDWFSSPPSSEDAGMQLLGAYYDEASQFSNFKYPSFDSWLAYLVSRVSDIVTVVGDLVVMNYASTSVEQASDRLIALANQSGGEATIPQIVAAAGGSGDTINWSAAIPEISSQTADDLVETVVDTAQNIGTGVLSTANLIKYLPWILGGAGVIYIVMMSGGPKKLFKR